MDGADIRTRTGMSSCRLLVSIVTACAADVPDNVDELGQHRGRHELRSVDVDKQCGLIAQLVPPPSHLVERRPACLLRIQSLRNVSSIGGKTYSFAEEPHGNRPRGAREVRHVAPIDEGDMPHDGGELTRRLGR